MKIKMKNGEFLELFNGLTAVQQLKGVKFGLLVSKNLRKLQTELDHLEQASKPAEEFVTLSTQVNQLMNEKKDKEIAKLEKENEKLIKERKEQLVEVEKLMKEEIEVQLHTIPEDCLPTDITGIPVVCDDDDIDGSPSY